MRLGDTETGLLGDCCEDWRALFEIPWGPPPRTAEESIALLIPLVEQGYLTTLEVTDWCETRTAEPMTLDDAIAVVTQSVNYQPPTEFGSSFYLLSITKKGENAISPDAFPAT